MRHEVGKCYDLRMLRQCQMRQREGHDRRPRRGGGERQYQFDFHHSCHRCVLPRFGVANEKLRSGRGHEVVLRAFKQ